MENTILPSDEELNKMSKDELIALYLKMQDMYQVELNELGNLKKKVEDMKALRL